MTHAKKSLAWKILQIVWISVGVALLLLVAYWWLFLVRMQNLGELVIGIAFFSYALAFLLVYLGISLIVFIIWIIKKLIRKK